MFDKVKNFFNRPFDPNQNVLGWFLFFGLLIVIAAAWKLIWAKVDRVV